MIYSTPKATGDPRSFSCRSITLRFRAPKHQWTCKGTHGCTCTVTGVQLRSQRYSKGNTHCITSIKTVCCVHVCSHTQTRHMLPATEHISDNTQTGSDCVRRPVTHHNTHFNARLCYLEQCFWKNLENRRLMQHFVDFSSSTQQKKCVKYSTVSERCKRNMNLGCVLTVRGEGERRKTAVLHFNGFDLGGKSYIRPHPSPPYCTAMQQHPQSSHTTGYTHVNTHTHPCQEVNTTAFNYCVLLCRAVRILSVPVFKHLLQFYLWNTNCMQGCANYCRRNAHTCTANSH